MTKTYSLQRTINLKRITGIDMFENTKFTVEGCASPKEAEKEIEDWVEDYITRKKKEFEAKKNEILEAKKNKPPFEGNEFNKKDSIVSEAQRARHLAKGGKDYEPKKTIKI